MKILITTAFQTYELTADNIKEINHFYKLIKMALNDEKNKSAFTYTRNGKTQVFPCLLLKNSIVEVFAQDFNPTDEIFIL